MPQVPPGTSSCVEQPSGRSPGKVPSRKYSLCELPALFCRLSSMAAHTRSVSARLCPWQTPLRQDPSCNPHHKTAHAKAKADLDMKTLTHRKNNT